MTAAWHCEAVDLRLNVDDGSSVLLEPCDINLNVKVSNAAQVS